MQACDKQKMKTKLFIIYKLVLYFVWTTIMKARKLEMQRLEEMKRWMWKSAMAVALFWVLSLMSPSEWYAKDMKKLDDGAVAMEIAKPSKKFDILKAMGFEMETKKMWSWIGLSGIDWGKDLDSGWGPDKGKDLDSDWGTDQGKDLDQSSEGSRIGVHGSVQLWSGVVPDLAEVCSDKPSMMICVDASDKGTWLWLTVIRLDDFHSDSKYPASKATVISPYRGKTFKDGKLSVWVSWDYTIIDELPDASGLMSKAVLSYSLDSGWTFEWKYMHTFSKWKDSDAIRVWITKKIGDVLELTAQWWYKSDYGRKFFGRVTVDIDLWGWFWAQMSCIAKDGKLTPTAWIVYKF